MNRTTSRAFVAVAALAVFVSAVVVRAQTPANRGVRATATIGKEPSVKVDGQTDGVTITNGLVTARWNMWSGGVHDGALVDLGTQTVKALGNPFSITLSDGSVVSAADMTVTSAAVENLQANAGSPQLVERFPGKATVTGLSSPKIPGPITWRVVLREGSAYVRQEVTIGPVRSDLSVSKITLVSLQAADAHVVGTVQGSPVASRDTFYGVEHPMSTCAVTGDTVDCSLAPTVPIRADQSATVSSVAGLAPSNQLRRSFLTYLERERVHPYRPFLHYNSWYDLGYFTPYTEADALNVVNSFGEELVKMRGVVLSSFLFDDGWDSHKTLWKFNDGFPNGFTNVRHAAETYGAEPGVWMSPFGGYGDPRTERLTYGKQEGFETNERGFALSGPVYYTRFRDTCLDMIRRYGINQFKFDGIGRAAGVVAGSAFGSDFEAAIHLIRDELRSVKPDIFINLTTGTWPSPFWLDYADTIWRGGEDHSFAGVGSKRQQWITYRDAQTYKNVVKAGPLFPLSSLMLHGLVFAQHAKDLDTDPGDDFTDEVRAYFGTGTELQEMYITPSLLSPENWDAIAESAKWARANADVLSDTHWIGGDPAALAVYGHAAWKARLGIVVLRNPSDKPATFALDAGAAFELPAGAATSFTARSPWRSDRSAPPVTLVAGTPTTIALKPFEVLTLEATASPVRR